MAFNPFLFEQMVLNKSNFSSPSYSTDSKNIIYNGCYTLVSCGGKQVKFWTLIGGVQVTENDIFSHDSDSGGFKARHLTTPKHKRHWTPFFSLEGNQAVSMGSPDMTCLCFLYDGFSGKRSKSRTLTGSTSGCTLLFLGRVDYIYPLKILL